MKKTITLLAAVLFFTNLIFSDQANAQSPEKLSYQSVIRNAGGSLVTNQAVGLQISILQGSVTGTAVFVETQNATTNANGLISFTIGAGTPVTGAIGVINWSAGPYFLKTETDPTGGTNYTITGTSELQSVPYALYAENGNWTKNGSDISNTNPGNVGIGTTAPSTARLVISGSAASEGLDLSSSDMYANMRVIRNSLGTADHDLYLGLGSGSTSSVHLYSDDNETVTITGGKLGIGTTSPGYIMDALGTGGPRLRIFSQDGIFAGLLTKNNTHEYFVGTQADYESASGTNSGFHIYDNTVGAQRMVIDADGNMGIGNYAPGAKLDVAGNIKIKDGTEGAGKVLTSDADGLASWQPTSIKAALNANIYFSPPFVMLDGQSYPADFSTINYIDNLTYANGIITVPEAGLYHFDLFASTAFGYTNNINMQIITNINGNLNDQHFSNALSTDLKLNAGDQVAFVLIQNSGSTQTLFSFSRLTCHKVF